MQKFYGNGKILLSGEYAIMFGAKGLCLPLKMGQTMEVTEINEGANEIQWQANDENGEWFSAKFRTNSLEFTETTDKQKASWLAGVLKQAKQMNPARFKNSASYQITSYLDFPHQYGLGSSSTLISNIARWTEVDAMELHGKISKGSGYDIVAAQVDLAFLYHLYEEKYPVVKVLNYNPSFKDNMFFVYSGKKVDTEKAIGIRKAIKSKIDQNVIDNINQITEAIVTCERLNELIDLLENHENLISKLINQPPLIEKHSGFIGAIKSLGAWGGDFCLAVTPEDEDYVNDYFKEHNISVIYPYNKFVL